MSATEIESGQGVKSKRRFVVEITYDTKDDIYVTEKNVHDSLLIFFTGFRYSVGVDEIIRGKDIA